MQPKHHRLIIGALGTMLITCCLDQGGKKSDANGGSKVKALPGVAPEVAEKTPKYRLYCATDLASLKTPSASLLVQEFNSIEDSKSLILSDPSKVSTDTYCLIDVAVKDTSQESQFKWLAKGADGSPLKGVFYRSNAVKPSSNALAIKLYRTFEANGTGTLDVFAAVTFPTDTPAKDLKAAVLSCGSTTFASTSVNPDAKNAALSSMSFSLPRTTYQDKSTTCRISANIGNDAFLASDVKLQPQAKDAKISLNVTMKKTQTGNNTLIIETTIK